MSSLSKKTSASLPQAVAATPVAEAFSAPRASGVPSLTAAPADAAGGRGNLRYPGSAVEGIRPSFGFTLMWNDEEDGDGFTTTSYFARGPRRDIPLNHSRFRFVPTQDRFDFLARLGFPQWLGGKGPFTDSDVDQAMQDEAVAVSRVVRAA